MRPRLVACCRRDAASRALQPLACCRRALVAFVALAVIAGCGNGGGDAGKDAGGDATAKVPGYTSALPSPYLVPAWAADGWAPTRVLLHDPLVRRRGLREVRGLVHAHTAYSHDACDDKPFDEGGKINVACVEDFRRDLCTVGHDFVFLTDHPTHFADHPFPDVLHYDKARGDELLTQGGKTVGSRMACPDGRKVVLLPGTEGATMAVGLSGHLSDDAVARKKVYGSKDLAARQALVAGGAIVLGQHTEDWTAEQLSQEGWGGFEMYNLHANMMLKLKDIAKLFPILLDENEKMQPDLVLLAVVEEDPRYLSTWAKVAAGGARRVTTLGTDCHRNTLTAKMSDGERVDSYRRMMIWFSNHLLVDVPAGEAVGDVALKAALSARRLFGVFEVLGYAEGFDARVESAAGVVEIGGEAKLSDKPVIVVDTPHVAGLAPAGAPAGGDAAGAVAEAPQVRSRILRADGDAWVEVAAGDGEVRFAPTQAGAYRAEVRMVPRHLRGHLGSLSELADREYVWIYANVFYVTE